MNRDLERHEAKTCCSAFAPSEPRLYFVYHERRKVSVWPRWAFGESDDLRLLATAANLTTGSKKDGNHLGAEFPAKRDYS